MSPHGTCKNPACVLCGSTKDVEHHHIGGRNHLAWATIPLCRSHHRQCHLLMENVGVDLDYTPDQLERLIRAAKAITIILCMILIAMHSAKSRRTKN
jgi:hypothetical protein